MVSMREFKSLVPILNSILFFLRLPSRLPHRSVSEVRASLTPFADPTAHAHRRHASSGRYLPPPARVDPAGTPAVPHLPPTSHADTLPLRKDASANLRAPDVGLRASSSRNSTTVCTIPRYAGQPVDQKRSYLPPLSEIPWSYGAENARTEPTANEGTRSSRGAA